MPFAELPSRYDPQEVESKWYAIWERSGYFMPTISPKQKPYTIMIPPPNVTGILHMGHALNNTIQDILIRWQRMKGVPTLWVPGVDHAGIATQNVVEKKLAKENKTRHHLGREAFLKEIWKWKEEHGSTIVKQLRRLGASCDWSRERFTMDGELSRAVRETFVALYERGLVYRGDYIINWCPRCHTALSDEEAVHHEIEGGLYYIKYPIEGSSDYVTVATTRPETMLGDTAVAIHPQDKRYRHLKGKTVVLPLLERKIPVIEDAFVNPEFGTGAVKVTPAHDPNDFEMGKRHRLEFVNVIHPDGRINENGGPYNHLDRFDARKRVISDLEKQGLFVKRESHKHAVGHCYRCHTIVEPYLSKQWFVRMKPLAEKAIRAAKQGKVKFYPDRWTKVYLNWLENIRDWCISRQIWWGHQIPVWYCRNCASLRATEGSEAISGIASSALRPPRNDGVIVSRETPSKCPKCGNAELEQDPDVLDTWFSSWLWPFSTLGWPEKTKDLAYFYPTSTLVTAQEIIFFWVARMIMAGLEFMGREPFHAVFIHGTVRVEGGQKMSKSLGNIIDPLEIIDEMGADALRFSLVMLAATDVYLTRQKFEMGRNFTNKIWNAFRFACVNLEGFQTERELDGQNPDLSVTDKWILAEADEAAKQADKLLSSLRFYEAANTLYHFFWHTFCDWYIELAKPVLSGCEGEGRKEAVRAVLLSVFEMSMRLLHPFMPFVTEEVWQRLKDRLGPALFPGETIMLGAWPEPRFGSRFEKERRSVKLFQDAVGGIRDLRSRLGLKPHESLRVIQICAKTKEAAHAVRAFEAQIMQLARVEKLTTEEKLQKSSGMVGRVYSDLEIFVGGLTQEDLKREREQTRKKIEELERLIHSIDHRLGKADFIQKAPEEVIEREKSRKEDFAKQIASYRENLKLFQ